MASEAASTLDEPAKTESRGGEKVVSSMLVVLVIELLGAGGASHATEPACGAMAVDSGTADFAGNRWPCKDVSACFAGADGERLLLRANSTRVQAWAHNPWKEAIVGMIYGASLGEVVHSGVMV